MGNVKMDDYRRDIRALLRRDKEVVTKRWNIDKIKEIVDTRIGNYNSSTNDQILPEIKY